MTDTPGPGSPESDVRADGGQAARARPGDRPTDGSAPGSQRADVRADGGQAAPSRPGEAWTVLGLVRWSGDYLAAKGVARGRLDAEHLLAHVLETSRMQLYLQLDRPLEADELDRYRPLLRRRSAREPLQYIVRRAAFRELELEVGPAVLVPRPETEELVDRVLEWARSEGRTDLRALDVGTGSGAIALSLASEGPFAEVVATDASAEALGVAGRNARRCGLEVRVAFRHGPLFEPVADGGLFDAVVSNPPYVAEGVLAALEPEVRDWEPRAALEAGPDGLAVLRPLVREAGRHLRAGGLLAVEVGHDQADAVVALAEAAGAYEEIRVRRDVSGRERIVLMQRD